MNNLTQKRRIFPTEQCQYGEDCYRKNPHHFMEYTHVHLNNIRNNCDGENYIIPSELSSTSDIILEQLKIIKSLFPSEPPAKRVATEANLSAAARPIPSSIKQAESTSNADGNNTSASPSQKTSNEINNKDAIEINGVVKEIASSSKTIDTPKSSNNGGSAGTAVPSKIAEHPRNIRDYIQVVAPRGKMAEKLLNAAPYNYFLTAITSSPSTHAEPQSITFQEILDPSLGEIESSVQINFMIDIGWLLGHYHFAGCLEKPMLVLYGSDTPELQTISQKKPQVTAIHIRMGNPFATHHTKMMLIGYKDKTMRVVVSTANLYEDDWHNRTQGLWISPRIEEMSNTYDTAAGESPTQFRNELLRYLTAYKLSHLQPWITRIRKCDFSAVNVFLVTSVPGTHNEETNGYHHGHAKVGWLLSKHAAPIAETSPVVAQSSSIGSFGANANLWLLGEFVNSFRRDSKPMGLRKIPSLRLVYPTFNNVMGSHDGVLGGGCLPYGGKIHSKQVWLQKYMFQWKASGRFRSQAMPHIKTYARWTDNKLFWFILTSANLSKAAWGSFNKGNKISTPLRIVNYEAGVMFLPKFIINKEYFPMKEAVGDIPPFPSLYDLPLIPYSVDDTPFLSDILFGE